MMEIMMIGMDVMQVVILKNVDSGEDYLEIVQNVGMEFLRKAKNVRMEIMLRGMDVMQVVKWKLLFVK